MASIGLSIITTIADDLHTAWDDLSNITEQDADDLWKWGSAMLTEFAAGELTILKAAAETAIEDVAADPLLVVSPGSEFTKFLSEVAVNSVELAAKLTPTLTTAILSLTHLNIGTTPANAVAHIAPLVPPVS